MNSIPKEGQASSKNGFFIGHPTPAAINLIMNSNVLSILMFILFLFSTPYHKVKYHRSQNSHAKSERRKKLFHKLYPYSLLFFMECFCTDDIVFVLFKKAKFFPRGPDKIANNLKNPSRTITTESIL